MAGRVVSQLLKGTNWGELDVLVLDLPPGTGDVQLEVCQSLSLSGAVAVSTPSALAWADDVWKGVEMFGELGVSTLALVENFAYFVCEGGGRHFPFGKARTLAAGDDDDNDDDGSNETSSLHAIVTCVPPSNIRNSVWLK
jgi:Mrp family chromosome partitioning ATPase